MNFDDVAAQLPRQVIPPPIEGGIEVRSNGSGWLCLTRDPPMLPLASDRGLRDCGASRQRFDIAGVW